MNIMNHPQWGHIMSSATKLVTIFIPLCMENDNKGDQYKYNYGEWS